MTVLMSSPSSSPPTHFLPTTGINSAPTKDWPSIAPGTFSLCNTYLRAPRSWGDYAGYRRPRSLPCGYRVQAFEDISPRNILGWVYNMRHGTRSVNHVVDDDGGGSGGGERLWQTGETWPPCVVQLTMGTDRQDDE